jgi:cell division protein FtsA
MAQQELQQSGCHELAASGIVLTGGAVQMEGMVEIAEDIFQLPVRKGIPTSVSGSSAVPTARLAEGGFAGVIADSKFATGVGLVLYGAAHVPMAIDQPRAKMREEGPGTLRRFGAWVREMF